MEIKNRERTLLITAIAALVLLVGNSLIYEPLAKSWHDRSDRIKKLQQDVARGTQLLDQRQRLESRWQKMETNTFSTEVSLAQSSLLKAFERWEQDSRIKIDRIAPQWKSGDDYSKLECRADASGSLDSVLRFLYDVEKDQLALKVEMVEISARDNDGQQLSLGLQLSGLILNPPAQQPNHP